MQYLYTALVSIITSFLVVSFFIDKWDIENTIDGNNGNSSHKPIDLDNFWLKDLEFELISTVDSVKESVVSITASKDFISYNNWKPTELFQQEVWWWSWILISKEGYILTNKHVINDEDAIYTVIFSDWLIVEVEAVWLDKNLDIAVIKVSDKKVWYRSPATIIDLEDNTLVWQFALAIWNALAEFQNSVTFWVISWNNRKLTIDEENLYAWLLQTDTSISEWNSWWPLFNLNWEVIWINTAVSAFWENIWFAIPITQQFVNATLQSIKNNNSIVRPFVWVRYIDIDSNVAKELDISLDWWIYIAEVIAWSPADDAWILKDDIITHVNKVKIDEHRPFLYQLFTNIPGQSLDVDIQRWSTLTSWKILLGQ